VGIRDLLTFTQEFSTLISAGLPMDRSLKILGTLTENEKLRETTKEVLTQIESGSSLAEALGQHPRIFSRLYVNMVKAGESGGFLEGFRSSRLVKGLTWAIPVVVSGLLALVQGGYITGAFMSIMKQSRARWICRLFCITFLRLLACLCRGKWLRT
jgi:hypothetical protein